MKKIILFVGFLLFTLYNNYAVERITYSKEKIDSSENQVVNDEKQDKQVLVISDAFIAITEFEGNSYQTNYFQSLSFKTNSSNYSNLLRISEDIYLNKFNQYVSASHNFSIKYRKADIIFPFHYHW